MKLDILIERIDSALKKAKVSERKAQIESGISTDFIRNLRRRGSSPKAHNLIKLANYLNVPVDYFLEAIDETIADQPSIDKLVATQIDTAMHLPTNVVYVKGDIQAGNWQDAIEWPREDWVPFIIPAGSKYEKFERYGLMVRGNSMNKIYPDKSIVIMVNFSEICGMPKNGDIVSTIRRDPLTDCFEATLKRVEFRENGEVYLWPESNDPEYLKPIILPKLTLHYGDTAGAPDLCIQGLVIGSVRSE